MQWTYLSSGFHGRCSSNDNQKTNNCRIIQFYDISEGHTTAIFRVSDADVNGRKKNVSCVRRLQGMWLFRAMNRVERTNLVLIQ